MTSLVITVHVTTKCAMESSRKFVLAILKKCPSCSAVATSAEYLLGQVFNKVVTFPDQKKYDGKCILKKTCEDLICILFPDAALFNTVIGESSSALLSLLIKV